MIQCISPYRSSYGQYTPGEMIDDAVLEAALLVDSPGSFEVVPAVEVRALDEPPAHRMMTGRDSEKREARPVESRGSRPRKPANPNPPPRMPKVD